MRLMRRRRWLRSTSLSFDDLATTPAQPLHRLHVPRHPSIIICRGGYTIEVALGGEEARESRHTHPPQLSPASDHSGILHRASGSLTSLNSAVHRSLWTRFTRRQKTVAHQFLCQAPPIGGSSPHVGHLSGRG